MTEGEAARLAKVAAAAGKTESDILREGIALAERQQRRSSAIDALIQMAQETGPEPRKIYWRGRV